MQIRQMLQKIWYQILSIHSIYWFDQSMFFSFFLFFLKLPFLVFESSKLYFLFSFSFFFFIKLFCLDGFKDHPTSVDKDELRKFTNSKGLCLSTRVMSMLIGQILHCREAEGWTVSNHAHTNISKEKVKSLFLIKHLTPEKCDTPLFFFFFQEVNLMICEKNKWLKMWQPFLISFLSFAESVYSYEVRCMIWIKKLCTCHYD